MALYQLEHINHSYNGRPVLCVDQWSVAEGTITCLCGPNGSGKSTLLKLLGFIESPTRGKISFKGRRADSYARHIRAGVTLLPQESYLLKRSVYKNIAYGLRIRGDRTEEARRIRQALSLVGLDPVEFAGRSWYALSGGEARRVALAARLVLRPRVLLLDEPTISVDAASAQLMKEAAIDAHRRWGATLIIASHDIEWLEDICHDIVYLFNGSILGQGRKTFIFGPWQRLPAGRVCRQLSEQQVFAAEGAPPDTDGAVAALDPADLSIHSSAGSVPVEKNSLEGWVTRMAMEKNTGRRNISVSVGQTEFILYPDAAVLAKEGYQPGSRAWIAYRPDRVQWFRSGA